MKRWQHQITLVLFYGLTAFLLRQVWGDTVSPTIVEPLIDPGKP